MKGREMVKFLSTDVRRGWVLCNICLAAGPILVTLLSASTDVYPVILSYCYALLVVGAYLSYRFARNRDTFVSGDTWFWSSIFVAVVILIFLGAYNSNPDIIKIVNIHWTVITILSSGTLILAFFLAYMTPPP